MILFTLGKDAAVDLNGSLWLNLQGLSPPTVVLLLSHGAYYLPSNTLIGTLREHLYPLNRHLTKRRETNEQL